MQRQGAKWAIFACLAMTRANILQGVPPLEAAAIGIHMDEDDVALRYNLVTLSEDSPYSEKDYD